MHEDKKLQGKVALVTGSARGMGLETAKLFLSHGAKVVLVDMDENQLDKVAMEIGLNDENGFWMKADASKYDDVMKVVDCVQKKYSTIDILVNNVGALRSTKFIDIDEQEWDFMMNVCLKSAYLFSRAVLPIMIKNRYGKIVNMSSSAGRSVSTLGGAHYTASKAGVLGLTRHLAKEMAKYNINVNAVCPGLIDTEMVRVCCEPERIKFYENSFPIQRLGKPSEVASLVLFLASEDSAYITGASIDINGGDLMM